MVIAFANNQPMSCPGSGATSMTTDPIPMGGNNQAAPILNVEYIFGTSAQIAYQGQMSNDGTNWVDVTGLDDSAVATGAVAGPTKLVDAAFIRFQFDFTAGGSGTAGVAFDLHVRLDHA